jgi:polyketide synthase PksM
MEALERLLAGPVDQIALIKASKPLAMEGMNTEKLITIYPENQSSVIANIRSHPILPNSNLGINSNNLLDEIETSVKQTAATILKVKADEIDIDVELNEYGFDTVMLNDFINRLNQEYRLELTPALLLDYSTIRSFTEYLLKEKQAIQLALGRETSKGKSEKGKV